MAIVFDAITTGTIVNATVLTFPFTAAPGATIIVGASAFSANAPDGATYNGVAMTLRKTRTQVDTHVDIFSLLNAGDGNPHDVVITYPASQNADAIVGGAHSWLGVVDFHNAGAAWGAFGNGTDATLTVGSAAGEVVVDVVAASPGGVTIAFGGGQSSLYNTPQSPIIGASSSANGAASVVMAATIDPANDWAHVALALMPAAGGQAARALHHYARRRR